MNNNNGHLAEMVDHYTGHKDDVQLDFKDIDHALSHSIRVCNDGLRGIGGLLMEIGVNIGKTHSDDNLPNEVFFDVGQLITELTNLVDACHFRRAICLSEWRENEKLHAEEVLEKVVQAKGRVSVLEYAYHFVLGSVK